MSQPQAWMFRVNPEHNKKFADIFQSKEQMEGNRKKSEAIARPIQGPYRTRDDQYQLQYFVEVAAVYFARANLSAQFWLKHFPVLAYAFPSTRCVLLTVSSAFRELQTYIDDGIDPGKQTHGQGTLERETQAMRLVAATSTAVEEVLADALGFWMKSMCIGDFAMALRHAWFAQKIIATVEDPSKLDSYLLKYCSSITRILLTYYQTTRGPCRIHDGDLFSKCESWCIIPEVHNLETRIADGLYHLRKAIPMLEHCKKLCEDQNSHRMRLTAVLKILEIQLKDFTALKNRWEEPERLGLDKTLLAQAEHFIPYTASPFNKIIKAMTDFIQKDEQNLTEFQQLELGLRVTLPTFIVSVGRGFGPVMVDNVLLTHSAYPTRVVSKVYGPMS
jgi:hypothetical protein